MQDGCIYIDQVRVYTDTGWVEKNIAKNSTRNRVQQIPDYLMELIEQNDAYIRHIKTGCDGYLFPQTRSALYNAWKRISAKHGIDISFHDLRHMSASIMLLLGVPEKYAQERGGWATAHVMKTVYQHTFSQERLAVDHIIDDYFAKSLNGYAERNPKESTDFNG